MIGVMSVNNNISIAQVQSDGSCQTEKREKRNGKKKSGGRGAIAARGRNGRRNNGRRRRENTAIVATQGVITPATARPGVIDVIRMTMMGGH